MRGFMRKSVKTTFTVVFLTARVGGDSRANQSSCSNDITQNNHTPNTINKFSTSNNISLARAAKYIDDLEKTKNESDKKRYWINLKFLLHAVICLSTTTDQKMIF